MKIYISGFAEAQKDVERKLSSCTDVIIEHIIKIVLMPNSESRKHWEDEITGQLKSISKIKNGKKFPSSDQIYKWTYGKKYDLVTDRRWMGVSVQEVEEDYGVKITESTEQIMSDVDNVCESYFMWISEQLSTSGKVTNMMVYNKLRELI